MNSEFLHFNPLFNVLWLALLLLLATFLFIVLEWKKTTRFIYLRIAAVIVAMLSLAMFLLRPSYRTQDKADQYLLLTPNYSEVFVDSLLAVQSDLQIVGVGEGRTNYNNIQTRQQLKALDGKIAIIAGEGLPASHFQLLQDKSFQFLPAPTPFGIVDITLPTIAYPGQWSLLQGTINIKEPTTLQLLDPTGKTDSLFFNDIGEHAFEFQLFNKQPGNVLYTLGSKSKSTEETFSLPLHVKKFQKLEILLLQLAPGFEMRQLKNFLSAQGHGLQVRSQLSKNNYSYEKVNSDLKQSTIVNSETLKKHDLLILERSTFEQLSKGELSAIQQAINAGLGVLVVIDESKSTNKSSKELLEFTFLEDDKDTLHLSLFGSSKKSIIKKQKLTLAPKPEIAPVLTHSNKLLTAYRHKGFGKVGIQLLNETYQLRLSGDSSLYAKLWGELVSTVARKEEVASVITLEDEFPYYPGMPLKIDFFTTLERPSLYYMGQVLPITEDVLIDNLWHATLRSQHTGWNAVQLNDSTEYTFFVSDKKEWSALNRAKQMKLHKTESSTINTTTHEKVKRHQDIPGYLFFLTFLLSMAFLWLAPKL